MPEEVENRKFGTVGDEVVEKVRRIYVLEDSKEPHKKAIKKIDKEIADLRKSLRDDAFSSGQLTLNTPTG